MNGIRILHLSFALAAIFGLSNGALAASSAVVGFNGGSSGGFTGNAFYETTGGNPLGNAHFLLETFGVELRTGAPGELSNTNFLGDYSSFSEVTFSVDIRVASLTFGGNQIPREIGFSLLDHDVQGPDGPAGLFFLLDFVSQETHGDWTTLSVTIEDPTQTDLPDGWVGFGDFDPVTFEPKLPDLATFASVLASVDEFRLTSFQPGYFYGFTNFNVRVDNLSVSVTSSAVPLPAALWLFGSGLLAVFMTKTRRS